MSVPFPDSDNPTAEDYEQPPDKWQEVVVAVAALMVVGGGVALIWPRVRELLGVVGIPARAAQIALNLAMSDPVWPEDLDLPPVGSAMAQTMAAEHFYRAAFVVESARRIEQYRKNGMTNGDAVAREQRYYRSHLEAQENRRRAAEAVDATSREHGPMLGWYSKLDERTTAECRAANGNNFAVGTRPLIGYPGTVHRHCRCVAGPPHSKGKDLPARSIRVDGS